MDFNHSSDRQMLIDTFSRFLRERYDFETRQNAAATASGHDESKWRELADLGVIAALFSENSGGFGGHGFDIFAVFESFGRALVVEPLLSAAMSAPLLNKHPELSVEIMAGRKIIVPAFDESDNRYDPTAIAARAVRGDGGWLLSGQKVGIAQLASAEQIIVSARTSGDLGDRDGLSLFLVPVDAKGCAIEPYAFVDGGQGGNFLFENVFVGNDALLGEEDRGIAEIEASRAAGILALVSEAIGIMEFIKETTIEYLQTRVQFGLPIGKFQALQHRMATVFLEIEQARSAVINASAAFDNNEVAREVAISAAKFTIGRLGTLIAEEAIQMHGGIGMTWELPLPHYAKRLIMIGHQLGDEDYHLERYIALQAAA